MESREIEQKAGELMELTVLNVSKSGKSEQAPAGSTRLMAARSGNG